MAKTVTTTISLPDLQKMLAPRDARVKPTEAQLASGDYGERFVMHVETGIKAKTHVTSHDPVQRWKRDGRLSDSQETAIMHVQALWAKAGALPRVTASYGDVRGGMGNLEHRAINEIEAREDLRRMQGYVPAQYWDVFENVCRWAMPAGVAGELLSPETKRGADIVARSAVLFVADTIAWKEGL